MYCLCEHCIEELRSRGEKIYASECIDFGTCDWCGEEDDLYEVLFSTECLYEELGRYI